MRNIFKKYGLTISAVVLAVGKGLKSVAKGVWDGFKTLGGKFAAILPSLISLIIGFISRAAESVISFLSQNAWLLILGVAIFMVEWFQNKKWWIKKAKTRPAEIKLTFTISWLVSLAWALCFIFIWWFCLHMNFSWSLINWIWLVRGWSVIFWWAPIHVPSSNWFHLQIHWFFDYELYVRTCLLQVLLYPTVLRVFRRVVEGMNQVPGETARSSLTFASLMVSWNLWTLFEMSGFLIASSTRMKDSCWASSALPNEPKIDDLTLTYTLGIQ